MKITEIELHEIHPPLRPWNREAHKLFAGVMEAANAPFMLQNAGANITLAMVVHMAAAFERATLHPVTATNLWEDDVVEPVFEVVAGQVRVPEEPGLGISTGSCITMWPASVRVTTVR